VRVTGVDHIVFRVADVERAITFYVDTLGLAPVRVDEWRDGAVLFPSVRIDASTIIDLFPRELASGDDGGPRAPNVDHVCLVVEPCDLQALADSGAFDVVGGPAELFGARGQGLGLYVRDPDGNVLELRHYDL
jgi:catechol 2,3-dioxygenase-like lactoylglutathione lyase family enzyme